MGPIKKFLWKRKYKNKIDRYIHSVRLLQTLGKLELYNPTPEEESAWAARVTLHDAVNDILRVLSGLK